jgi:hypothetical protein
MFKLRLPPETSDASKDRFLNVPGFDVLKNHH